MGQRPFAWASVLLALHIGDEKNYFRKIDIEYRTKKRICDKQQITINLNIGWQGLSRGNMI